MNKENFFISSDLHLNHEAVIGFSNRPFANAEEMNRVLIDNINEVVGENDTYVIAGDIVFGQQKVADAIKFRKQIKCRNVMWVRGNHDPRWDKMETLRPFFREITPYLELKIDGQVIVICHYPILVWYHHDRGAWHCHGHCHNGLWQFMLSASRFEPLRNRKMLDVGVDNPLCGYKPFSYAQIEEYMNTKQIVLLDHHRHNSENNSNNKE